MSFRHLVDTLGLLGAWRTVATYGITKKVDVLSKVSTIAANEFQYGSHLLRSLATEPSSLSSPRAVPVPAPGETPEASGHASWGVTGGSKESPRWSSPAISSPIRAPSAFTHVEPPPQALSGGISRPEDEQSQPTPRNVLEDVEKELPAATKQSLRARSVPRSRVGRFFHFGSLALGLGAGAMGEALRRAAGSSTDQGSYFMTEGNVRRLVQKLTQLRGAALKVGQILSIQDTHVLPKSVEDIIVQVQNAANYIPTHQMHKAMEIQLGEQWRSKFSTFDDIPFAAASIGQVHRAKSLKGREVCVKLQYPGIAGSIDSDLSNLKSLIAFSGVLPKGLYLDQTIQVARKELMWETDYVREAKAMDRFRDILEKASTPGSTAEQNKALLIPFLEGKYRVPAVEWNATTSRVLTSEYVDGLPLGRVAEMSSDVRNRVAMRLMALCLRELFEFRFMQTDPNWGNFLYNAQEDILYLLDFGSAREFDLQFTDPYVQVLKAAAMNDREGVEKYSLDLKFLTGYESTKMTNAHIEAVLTLGLPFRNTVYDFSGARTAITERVRNLIPTMLEERLTPPPDESYSLHRKLSGMFLLCSKLKAEVPASQVFWEAVDRYEDAQAGRTPPPPVTSEQGR